ncbi:hypothetical protein DFH09DRAFT_1079826 [Mycena vulgaris]|nr:hypothetical protein DFH09DRAFT_1079826 [Mycena vulgaris]
MPLCKWARDLLGLCGMSGGSVDCNVVNSQAENYRLKSEYLEACNIHTEILQNVSPFQHALALFNVTQIDVEIGVSEHDAQSNIDAAKVVFTTTGSSMGVLYRDAIQAGLHLREGEFVAETLLRKCLILAWGKNPSAMNYCLKRLVMFSAGMVFKLKQKLETHKALQFLGNVFVSWGDQDTAISIFTVALDGFTQMDVHRSQALSHDRNEGKELFATDRTTSARGYSIVFQPWSYPEKMCTAWEVPGCRPVRRLKVFAEAPRRAHIPRLPGWIESLSILRRTAAAENSRRCCPIRIVLKVLKPSGGSESSKCQIRGLNPNLAQSPTVPDKYPGNIYILIKPDSPSGTRALEDRHLPVYEYQASRAHAAGT